MMQLNSVDGTLPLAGYPSRAYTGGAPGGEDGKVYGPVLNYREAEMTLRPLTVLPRHTNGIKPTHHRWGRDTVSLQAAAAAAHRFLS